MRGFPAAIAGRNAAKLEGTTAELRSAGAKVVSVIGDASLAEAYWMPHHQHRSAWILELDLRPWSEAF